MQAKVLLLSFLLSFIPLCNFAQTSASANGIAIQGIARDTEGNAKTNVSLKLKFTPYYIENGMDVIIDPPIEEVNITTDNFGVFSYILNPGVENNSKFANNQVYLKIEDDTNIISNEKLNHVPYAISANNGVPTGSIMPFIGTTAPEGWAMCKGQDLTTLSGSDELRALLNSNFAPDLQGTFLRGTGTSAVNGQDGPALMTTQDDAFEAHLHAKGTLGASGGSHSHTLGRGTTLGNNPGVTSNAGNTNFNPSPISGGGHTHNISGSTAETGDLETRPVNYGVNYIIKL